MNLPFDILCYLPENAMTLWKMHWKLVGTLKRPVVQNCAHGTTKQYKRKSKTRLLLSMKYTKLWFLWYQNIALTHDDGDDKDDVLPPPPKFHNNNCID